MPVSVQVTRAEIIVFGQAVDPKIVIVVVGGVLALALLFIFLLFYSRRPTPAPVSPTVPMGGSPTAPAVPTVPSTPAATPGVGYVSTVPPTPGYPPAAPSVPGYQPTVPPTAPVAPGMPPVAGPGMTPVLERTETLRPQPLAMGWLIMQQGPWAGREFRLGEVTAIGRTGDNDVVLDDPSVSRQHAKVKLEGKTFWIHDMGATNTTKVNGQEVGRHQLTDGDRVEIGRMALVFKQVQPGQA